MNSVKELLKVAEWMHPNNKIGERCHPSHGHGVFIDNIGEYNPLTNDTQCLELLEKLVSGKWSLQLSKGGAWPDEYTMQKTGFTVTHSKSLPEAILLAAIEEV